MLLIALLSGCLRDAPLPDVGDCARYPDGVYDYGEIGIGTCIAGPTELALTETPEGQAVVLVTNANPYQIFTGGSLLALPWDEIDLGYGRNVVSDLGAGALDLPDFAGGLDHFDDLGLVAVRLSEDALTRVNNDDIYLVDLGDPLAPRRSDQGDGGGATVTVESDPNDVVVDEQAGRAYVANRTSHTISVLDLTGDEVEIVLPWPEQLVTAARFADRDGSGSRASLADFAVEDDELLPSDAWTMTWVDGTWRVWVPGAAGLWRAQTTGDGAYHESAIGAELAPDPEDGIDEIQDPFYDQALAQMLFVTDGTVQAAFSDSFLGDWVFKGRELLEADSDGWDADIGGPCLVYDDETSWLFYDGTDGGSWGIGAASSTDGYTWDKLDAPVIEPTWDHEGERVGQPFVLYDPEAAVWRMYYSAYDGQRWTIGHATSSDLETWQTDEAPVFALDGLDAAAPAVTYAAGAWSMWYARRGEEGWSVAAAESADGYEWTDIGTVLVVDAYVAFTDEPPRPAVDAETTRAFRVEGESVGTLYQPVEPGVSVESVTYGWSALAVAGFHLDAGDAGSSSEGGIRVDSVDPDAGLAWLTLTSGGGRHRIGVATIQADGSLEVQQGAIFEGTEGFDRDGVASPVVVADEQGYRMYYAGERGAKSSIGLARSEDGLSWTRVGRVLANGDDWDSVAAIPGSLERLPDGSERLWYSGYDDETWRIGAALTTDGESFTRQTGTRDWLFGTGSPGEADDSGVRGPWALAGVDEQGQVGTHLWYAGTDGDTWRIFYAWKGEDDEEFARAADTDTEETRPVVDVTDGLFHPDGVDRPVLVQGLLGPDDATWRGWFAGLMDDVVRVGRLTGLEPDRLHRVYDRPTAGDTLAWSTQRGDDAVESIPLDQVVEGNELAGNGLTSLTLDPERGFLYAVSKLHNYVWVVDVRDDSDKSRDFVDLNYLDIEAILPVQTSSGATGFRQVLPVSGTDRLYALNDAPEAIYVFDLGSLEDDAYADVVYDAQIGFLPAPRANERDEGVRSQASVGPAQLVAHPDGRRLFLTNYNANSISVYDLSLGPYGQEVAEVELVGENPYAIALTEDARYAVFANYSGEVDEDGLCESTLAVLDVDESSPTYLEVLTWIANR